MKGEGRTGGKEGENSEVHLKLLQSQRDNAKIQIKRHESLGAGVKRESCIFFGDHRAEKRKKSMV